MVEKTAQTLNYTTEILKNIHPITKVIP